jgi:amidophosphoribosyltransferase
VDVLAGIGGVIKFNMDSDGHSMEQIHGVAKELYYILFGLQNRGQASGKMIIQLKNPSEQVYFYNNGCKYTSLSNIKGDNYLYVERKGDGAVRELFDTKIINDLFGDVGIGGVSNRKENHSASLPYRYKIVSVGKDGWIENTDSIKNFLIAKEVPFKTTHTEVEVFAKLFHFHFLDCGNPLEAMRRCAVGYEGAPALKGLYSAVATSPSGLVAISNGKPLGMIKLKDRVYFSSESAAPWSHIAEMNSDNFSQYWEDLKPGMIVQADRNGTVIRANFPTTYKICSFEWAYFARPDSVIHGKEVGAVRMEIARRLIPILKKNITYAGGNFDNCIVVPALESGNWYGIGISEATHLPLIPALHKDKYSLKSFILDMQADREREVSLKHIPSVTLLKGKEIILTEDSIVRGTTTRIIIQLLKEKGGAKKVHVIAGFPIKCYACAYSAEGSATLIANDAAVEAVRERIKADSLTYGTHEVWEAVLGPECCYSCERDPTQTTMVQFMKKD